MGNIGEGKQTSSNISSMDKELTIVASSLLTLLLLKKEVLSMFVKLEWENIEQYPGAKSSGAGFSLGLLISSSLTASCLP